MLKSLIFTILSGMTFSAFAQTYDICVNTMEKYYLASPSEASTVCRQNSTAPFLQCMVHRALNSTIHILEAAPKCSSFRVTIPLENPDQNYVNVRSCPSKMQIRLKLGEARAQQICNWDSSELMQNCLLDLTEKANFHNEHAIQYCSFANQEYRNKIPSFVACVISNARKGYDVFSNVSNCDRKLTGGVVIKPNPRTETQPEPRYEPNYPPVVQPEPQVVPTEPTTTPPVKTGGRKVPTPVEIKIEGSSKPEVTGDQPINTGDTSNSGSLPL